MSPDKEREVQAAFDGRFGGETLQRLYLRDARAMGPEWRDISTAAIDGHRQLLSGPYHDGSIRGWTAIGSWSTREDGWVDDTQRRFDPQPTHWQPLPAPPKES